MKLNTSVLSELCVFLRSNDILDLTLSIFQNYDRRLK